MDAVDLSEEEWTKVSVPKPHVLKEVPLPHTVLNSDLLINVPGVGTHSTTRLTCALKNLFGLLPEKRKFSVYHPLGIDEIVADIYQAVKPDLNIVDAYRVTMDNGPSRARKEDVILKKSLLIKYSSLESQRLG